ncbi:MAG: M20/M25/M40 family metallo-hydrolase [Flavobacteriales bacterium]|nr:M20/M25/M40 family metallo-hydrolase [Flavobacteriales bacterium]
MRHLLSIILSVILLQCTAQSQDSLVIRSIYDEALEEGECYENLRSLCKDIGARLTGSAEAEMAVQWGKQLLESYGFATRLQETPIPHWERGTLEAGWYVTADGSIHKIKVLALGGSIGTDGMITAEGIEARDIAHLKELGEAGQLKDKIVFINKPFDQKLINTFRAYGACWPIRGHGAKEAARYGAKAVLIRSLATPIDDHPHTGSMYYEEGVPKIPGAAISTQASEELHTAFQEGNVELRIEMDCRSYPDKVSHNVIGEMKGSTYPDEIITIGGHLDSWDVGEGAHDDGAGIVHCIEAMRILKGRGIKLKRTLRVVLYMNEENGAYGAETYADKAIEAGEKHVFALESDAGGHTPRGFSLDGPPEKVELMKSFQELLYPYGLNELEAGYGGVDIARLKNHYEGITLIGFRPDSQRYFNFHHSENDIFENVNKRELELGAASIATMVYLMDRYWEKKTILEGGTR